MDFLKQTTIKKQKWNFLHLELVLLYFAHLFSTQVDISLADVT